ncbi:MAG: hypothetical protein CMG69_03790 [Candidatus Marinimicrobia bacterium]|nr:hypothetical protein [Candidatus Neomarinimicrobiota bacterium]|tara:strand:- start:79666 stop:80400 length:735 start_codon:yes stop_codon:yes gene_type:complete
MKIIILHIFFITLTFASQSHSLIGFRGLIFTPSTGVFPNDGESSFGYRNIISPYTFINWSDKTTENHLFFGSLVFFPRLDITGVITFAPNSHGNDGTDTYKDFALFAHIELMKEGSNIPSLMLGIHDFYSYSYYNAFFLSSSKLFELNQDIQITTHIGYGVDWMNQHYGDTGPDKDAEVNHYLVGSFGGIDIIYQNYGSIMIEYDTHQINCGIRLNLFDRYQITAVLLNLEAFSFGLDYSFSLI